MPECQLLGTGEERASAGVNVQPYWHSLLSHFLSRYSRTDHEHWKVLIPSHIAIFFFFHIIS